MARRRRQDPEAGATYPGKLRILRGSGLSSRERTVEARFAAQLEADPAAAVEEYLRRFGNVVSTDPARELSPDYAASREAKTRWSAAVYQPAKALARAVYEHLLRQPVPAGKNNDVLFLAGGAGAGKTTALEGTESAQALHGNAHIIVNGSLAGEAEADAMIRAALDAGKTVNVVYVHRPVEKATVGVIDRALQQGRTVSRNQIAALHFGAQNTVLNLAKKYGDRVGFIVLDNSRGRGEVRVASLAKLERMRYRSLEEVQGRVHTTIEHERAQRTGTPDAIPESIYRSLRGAHGATEGGDVRGESGGEPQPKPLARRGREGGPTKGGT